AAPSRLPGFAAGRAEPVRERTDAVLLARRSQAGLESAAAPVENWRRRGSAGRFLPPMPARRYRAATSWRGSGASDAAGPPPRPAVLAGREGETSASGQGSRAPPVHAPDSARTYRTSPAWHAGAF